MWICSGRPPWVTVRMAWASSNERSGRNCRAPEPDTVTRTSTRPSTSARITGSVASASRVGRKAGRSKNVRRLDSSSVRRSMGRQGSASSSACVSPSRPYAISPSNTPVAQVGPGVEAGRALPGEGDGDDTGVALVDEGAVEVGERRVPPDRLDLEARRPGLAHVVAGPLEGGGGVRRRRRPALGPDRPQRAADQRQHGRQGDGGDPPAALGRGSVGSLTPRRRWRRRARRAARRRSAAASSAPPGRAGGGRRADPMTRRRPRLPPPPPAPGCEMPTPSSTGLSVAALQPLAHHQRPGPDSDVRSPVTPSSDTP